MNRNFLLVVLLATVFFISSCGVNETKDLDVLGSKENAVTSQVPTKPVVPTNPIVTTESPSEIILTKGEIENLGLLIKWVYNSNLIYNGDDDSSLQLPKSIILIPTDQDKIEFIIALASYENLIEFNKEDAMTYSFTSDYADSIIDYAVGENFCEHKAYDNEIDYKDGTYYYSLVGTDGAMWWPSIEIQNITPVMENKIKVVGILKSEHDIYTKDYSYDFEAIAIKNPESPFGGYTLEDLSIK